MSASYQPTGSDAMSVLSSSTGSREGVRWERLAAELAGLPCSGCRSSPAGDTADSGRSQDDGKSRLRHGNQGSKMANDAVDASQLCKLRSQKPMRLPGCRGRRAHLRRWCAAVCLAAAAAAAAAATAGAAADAAAYAVPRATAQGPAQTKAGCSGMRSRSVRARLFRHSESVRPRLFKNSM